MNVFFQKIFTSHNNEDLTNNSTGFVPKLEFLKDGLGDQVRDSNQAFVHMNRADQLFIQTCVKIWCMLS